MQSLAQPALSTLVLLCMTGTVFGLLAVVTKRRAFGDAVVRSRSEFITNLGLTIINSILLVPLFVFPEGALRSAIGSPNVLATSWNSIPDPLIFAAAVLVFDFVVYWRHRLEHTRFFWPFHATHHADTAMHWLSVLRKHPVSKLLSVSVDIALLLLLGVPEWAIGLAGIVRGWWGFFIHADVPWTLGVFGHVLIAPAAHRLHHIRDEALMGSNYGNTVTLWDKMFGTYVDPSQYLNCETGIAEGTRGLGGELLRPFEQRYWRRKREEETAEIEPAI